MGACRGPGPRVGCPANVLVHFRPRAQKLPHSTPTPQAASPWILPKYLKSDRRSTLRWTRFSAFLVHNFITLVRHSRGIPRGASCARSWTESISHRNYQLGREDHEAFASQDIFPRTHPLAGLLTPRVEGIIPPACARRQDGQARRPSHAHSVFGLHPAALRGRGHARARKRSEAIDGGPSWRPTVRATRWPAISASSSP